MCNRSDLNRKILYENFDGLNVAICLKVILNSVGIILRYLELLLEFLVVEN